LAGFSARIGFDFSQGKAALTVTKNELVVVWRSILPQIPRASVLRREAEIAVVPSAASPHAIDGSLFRTPESASFAHVYRQLQDETGQLVPARKLLKLSRVPRVAPYFGIFEFISPETIMVRLVGTGFVRRTGIDNSGRNMLDLCPPELREWTSQHFSRMLKTPCGSVCISREAYGAAHMLTEVVSFPFADATGETKLIISSSIPMQRKDFPELTEGMKIGGFHDLSYLDIGAGVGDEPVVHPTRR
jgi:hypothetical protein